MLSCAIIGSGPAGFFCADILSKKLADCEIDLLDKLPTPMGLVRAGVAPDHPGTKNITRQFDRILQRPMVNFFGGIELGKNISYQTIKEIYDIVILSVGCNKNKSLDLPGSDHASIYGALEIVSWYNGHPDFYTLNPAIDHSNIAIIGNGNVALDIARVFAKTADELATSDMPSSVLTTLSAHTYQTIYVIGRRGLLDTKFSAAELQELSQLDNAYATVDVGYLPADADEHKLDKNQQKNLNTFTQFSNNKSNEKATEIKFIFNATPTIFQSENSDILSDLQLKISDDCPVAKQPTMTLPVGAAVTAIGYQSSPLADIPFDHEHGTFKHQAGLIEQGVYTCGWCSRGAQGVIPANRQEAQSLCKNILTAVESQQLLPTNKAGRKGLLQWVQQQKLTIYTQTDWQTLDQLELQHAKPPKVREKLTNYNDIQKALNQ